MIRHLTRHLGVNRKIHRTFGRIFMAVILVGAFSAINANESKDYSTLTIAAKADKKSTKADKSTSGGGGTDKYAN